MSREDSLQQPTGAIGLAWSVDVASEHCEAFRVGLPEGAVHRLQFRPELTVEMRNNNKRFDPVPDANQVVDTVNTGRWVLNAWVKLAASR